MAKLTPKQLKFNKKIGRGEKFNNQYCHYDGKDFDSVKEMKRYQHLMILQRLGKIKDLKTQVKFEILPTTKICGETQRKVIYIADFTYILVGTDSLVVEDAKGARTDVYRLKRKLMKVMLGIDVVEV